jgi:hypothetical protein
MSQRKYLDYIAIVALYMFIYYAVFGSEYVYLDEINQLWWKEGKQNFLMFATQGRWLTGVLFEKFFRLIDSVSELKALRIFSLIGWILVSFVLYHFFQRWQKLGGWSSSLPSLMIVFTAASLPVAVFIGWASCMEMFLGVLFAALGSHLLFVYLQMQTQDYISIPTSRTLLIILCGVTSLFLYQSSFGLFLLPFLIHYFYNPDKIGKKQIIPLFYYLITYVIYFALFKYSLSVGNLPVSDRAEISFNVLDKISFFFSGPLPAAFTFNYVYQTQSLLPQILAPLLMLLWCISIFAKHGPPGIRKSVQMMAVTLLLLSLMYIPSLIAKENFPAYRTLFAFQLAVLSVCVIQLEYFLRNNSRKKIIMAAIAMFIVVLGFYNFNFQFQKPLAWEYKVFHTHFKEVYKSATAKVFFIRSSEKTFQKKFGIKSANDEIGRPSTSREWVPEHLIRQSIYEITKDKKRAELVEVVQFADHAEFRNSNPQITERDVVIDMDRLLLGN